MSPKVSQLMWERSRRKDLLFLCTPPKLIVSCVIGVVRPGWNGVLDIDIYYHVLLFLFESPFQLFFE